MADGVQVQGPDGNTYQFPAGTDKNAAITYFKKKGIGVDVPRGTDDATSPSPPGALTRFAQSFGVPTSRAELEQAGKPSVSGLVESAFGPAPQIGKAVMGYGKQLFTGAKEGLQDQYESARDMIQGRITPGQALGKYATGGLHSALRAVPFVGPTIETAGQDWAQKNYSGALGGMAGAATNVALMRGGASEATATPETLAARSLRSQLRQMTKQEIVEQAHAKLNSQVEPTQRLIRDVPLAGMKREVGQHVAGLDAGDIAASPQGRPQVNTTSLHPLVDDLTNSHRSAVHSPRFQQAIAEITNLPASAYWKDVQDAKMRVRSLWSKAPEGTPEASALGKLSEGMEDILGQRAAEIGQTPQYNKYRELTRAYHAYESGSSAIGKLLNANLGKDFFSILRDPALADQLKGASKDFAKYGLPEDTLSKLTQNNAQLHDFVTTSAKSGGFRGKIKALMQEPLSATAGMMGGSVLGGLVGHPTLGGMIGAMKAADMAETFGARGVLAKQGLAPSRAMIGEPVAPSPATGPTAAGVRAGTPTVSTDDLLSAMKGQGIPKAEAVALARKAVQDNPNDFSAALKQVLQRKPVGKAQQVAQARQRTINASGESSASMEALSRVASERNQGITRVRIDTRSGKETPLWGSDAVDAKAGPYDKIVKRSPKGDEVLDKGEKAR